MLELISYLLYTRSPKCHPPMASRFNIDSMTEQVMLYMVTEWIHVV
jgi:hypothetical protein